MIISCSFAGRLRVRDKRLKNPQKIEEIRGSLAPFGEICEMEFNAEVGSLLVLYNPSPGVGDEITAALERLLPSEGVEAAPGCSVALPEWFPFPSVALDQRKLVKSGMLASLLSSLIGVVLGKEKLHVISGLLFLGFLTAHLSSKRRFLFS